MKNTLSFFTNKSSSTGFITFGSIHLLILFIAFTIGIFIFKIKNENRQVELFLGWVLIIQQIALYSWYFIKNYNPIKEGLPLYHCRMAIIFLGLGLVFKNINLTKLGSYLGLFGSLGALFFPSLDPFKFPHITQFSFFIGHLFLLWGSIYSLSVKKIGMSNLDLKNTLIFINVYHLLMYVVNNYVGSNYGYMNSPPFKIGFEIPHLLYGSLVIVLVSTILIGEYMIINRNSNLELSTSF